MTALATVRPATGGFTRRGACPALSAPMKTGDGLLVRLNPVAGGLTPKALIGLCDAAQEHGNGIVEVTARGNIQIRGLTDASAPQFADAVNRLGIPVHTGVPVQTNVIARIDPDEIRDPSAFASSLRAGIDAARLESRLGPKVSVVVDGGGKSMLGEVAADVRLTGVTTGWEVSIAGDAQTARSLGVAENDELALSAALTLLSAIAGMGRDARARDLDDRALSGILNDLTTVVPQVTSSGETDLSPIKSLIGVSHIRDHRLVLGIALPYGSTTATRLKAFAEVAATLGVKDIRPAPQRTLVAICGAEGAAKELRKAAEALGFITSPDDPRRSVSACPGAPECASGHFASRSLAATIAKEQADLLDGSVHLHVSGCAKGCAHPAASTLTLVGNTGGVGLVINGTARGETLACVDSDGAGRAFASLARLVSAQGRMGKPVGQVMREIGLSALAEAFAKGRK